MGTSKRERQKIGHRARLDAERAARRRYERRRRVVLAVSSVVGVIVVVALFVWLSDDTPSDTTTTTTTTSTPSSSVAAESAAGKDCVALSDPLPAGAPEVPVPLGPPPSELVVEDLTVGSGAPVVAGDTVTVNYIGVSCSTGGIFDASWTRGEAATFPLGQVIPGWEQGLIGMQPGGRRLVVIPPDLAYGAGGRPNIAPDETLVFVVDLVSTTPTGSP